MRFGLDISQHQLDWEELLGRARLADDAGFEGVWVFDHFTPLYGDPAGPCLEAWTLLAALAASTRRVRLGSLVTGVTYRHPAVLAAEAVTVDHVSGGRLDIGLGAAWYEPEHRALGIPFPPARERLDRLEDAVEIIHLLMTGENATFSGRHARLENATYRPRPVQRPHPPIWIGAGGERRGLPLAARHADAWHAFGSLAELRRKSELLDRLAQEAGRNPGEILRSTSLSISEPWDEVRSSIEGLQAAGFGYLVVSFPAEGRSRLETFIETVLPAASA